MTVDAPVVRDLETAVYVVPTDAPEADGTRTWPPRSRTCAMWSTSMTIRASSKCSLTVRSIQAAGY
jgi:hypothetical protein